MKFRKLTTVIGVCAAAALLFTACSGQSGSGDATTAGDDPKSYLPIGDEVATTADKELAAMVPQKYRDNGVLKIAVGNPFPPFNMFDDKGRSIGFDSEMARLIGQKLDIPVEITNQAFDTVIPSLQAEKNDIIMAGMNDTAERQKTLVFIDYIYAGFGIVVPEGNPGKINTLMDLCGKTVALQKSTVQGQLLTELDCGIRLMELPNDIDSQTALRAGKADAYVSDSAVAEFAAATVEDGKAFDIISDPENPSGFNPVYTGIGILKENTELIDVVQKAFQALIDEGSYEKVLKRSNLTDYAVDSAELNQGS